MYSSTIPKHVHSEFRVDSPTLAEFGNRSGGVASTINNSVLNNGQPAIPNAGTPYSNLMNLNSQYASNSNIFQTDQLGKTIDEESFKFTPRCLTPLNFDINQSSQQMGNLLNATASDNLGLVNESMYGSMFVTQKKDPIQRGLDYDAGLQMLGSNQQEQPELQQQEGYKEPLTGFRKNIHYTTLSSPMDSNSSLSPYQRNSLLSTEDYINAQQTIDTNQSDITYSNSGSDIYNNNATSTIGELGEIYKDRILSNLSDMDLFVGDLKDNYNAALPMPLLPSQTFDFRFRDNNEDNINYANNIINNSNEGNHYIAVSLSPNTVGEEDNCLNRNPRKRRNTVVVPPSTRVMRKRTKKAAEEEELHGASGEEEGSVGFHDNHHHHSHSHHSDKQFKCTQCSSSFTRKTRLTEHMNRVHLGKVYHFECEQCGTRLSSKENLTRHSIVHTDKFKCHGCDRRFDRSYRYLRHIEKCSRLH
ncbi:Zinc finger and SCAN domain-containing protein 22 [Pichia kudriavzevii]|uniref:Zinc finger and SCAN domain-containing protein 22 n=1 Tax=Pichia kudriavzevii TaxID=4909 RepID=A0A1V2LFK2_PICKU|nr:Zinc finger and SCAN domain-containing protein 22 [Pichia kudriavzevii]